MSNVEAYYLGNDEGTVVHVTVDTEYMHGMDAISTVTAHVHVLGTVECHPSYLVAHEGYYLQFVPDQHLVTTSDSEGPVRTILQGTVQEVWSIGGSAPLGYHLGFQVREGTMHDAPPPEPTPKLGRLRRRLSL